MAHRKRFEIFNWSLVGQKVFSIAHDSGILTQLARYRRVSFPVAVAEMFNAALEASIVYLRSFFEAKAMLTGRYCRKS